jgi:hypothetical protein
MTVAKRMRRYRERDMLQGQEMDLRRTPETFRRLLQEATQGQGLPSSMTRDNWRDATTDIEQAAAPATERQHQLAAVAGITLPKEMPQLVAAARLQTALGADIGSDDEAGIDEVYEDLMASLQTPTLRITTPAGNRAEARAWITWIASAPSGASQ